MAYDGMGSSNNSKNSEYASCTRAIHADDSLNTSPDVAPPLHLSTTFRYADDPNNLVPASDAVVRLLYCLPFHTRAI